MSVLFWGVPMFLSTPWGVDVSGFRLAVVGALRPAGGVRRPFPRGPVRAMRAGEVPATSPAPRTADSCCT